MKIENLSTIRAPIFIRVLLTLFFLVFFAAGTLIFFEIYNDVSGGQQSRNWSEQQCNFNYAKIVTTKSDSDPYYLKSTVSYYYQGTQFTSVTKSEKTDDYAWLDSKKKEYERKQTIACFVNPEKPGEVSLGHESPLLAFALLFPLIFVAIGLGGLYYAWTFKDKTKDSAISASAKRKDQKPDNGKTVKIVFLVIGIICGALSYFFTFPILTNYFSAQQWPENRCEVISSKLRSFSSDDGRTYKIDIVYKFNIDGVEYFSNRYSFMDIASSGYSSKKQIVNQHRSGKIVSCWVDPSNPHYSLLDRDFTFMFILLLIPPAIGIPCLFGLLRSNDTSLRAQYLQDGVSTSISSEFGSQQVEPSRGETTLEPESSPVKSFWATFLFAAIWNGFVAFAYFAAMDEGGDTALLIFLGIFGAVGLGLIGLVIYTLLSIFNPRASLSISRGAFYPEEEVRLRWSFDGQVSRIKKLIISIEGEEEVRYRRGTNTYTDRETFFKRDLLASIDTHQIQNGEVAFSLPKEAMHSFEAPNNKIIWKVSLKADIPFWPDVSSDFKMTVLPNYKME